MAEKLNTVFDVSMGHNWGSSPSFQGGRALVNILDFQLKLLTKSKVELEIGQPSQKLKHAFK